MVRPTVWSATYVLAEHPPMARRAYSGAPNPVLIRSVDTNNLIGALYCGSSTTIYERFLSTILKSIFDYIFLYDGRTIISRDLTIFFIAKRP